MEKQKPKLVSGTGAQETAKQVETKVSAAPAHPQLPTQREAVYNEVMRIIREEKINIAPNQAVKPSLNETHIKKICTALVAGFKAKKIALKETESNKKKLTDDKVMELYCLGLLNNWLRKDKRLNGVASTK